MFCIGNANLPRSFRMRSMHTLSICIGVLRGAIGTRVYAVHQTVCSHTRMSLATKQDDHIKGATESDRVSLLREYLNLATFYSFIALKLP